MRRILIILVALLALAQPVAAQTARVQSKTHATAQPWAGAANPTLDFDAPTTAGNWVFVFFAFESASRTVSGVTNGSNTLSLVGGDCTTEIGATMEGWVYAGRVTTPSATVQVTISSTAAAAGKWTQYEISGGATTAVGDLECAFFAVSAATSGAVHNAGPVTVAAANAFLLNFTFGTSGDWSVIDATFTEDAGAETTRGTSGYKANPSTGANSSSNSSVAAEQSVNFLLALEAAPAGGTLRRRTMVGFGD